MAIETDDNARRIPAGAILAYHDRRVPRLRAAGRRRQDRRRGDARRRPLRLGCARHFPPRGLRQAAQVRHLQSARQHQGARAQPRDRAGRRRQRHGPSGDDLRRPISRSSSRARPASAGSACAAPTIPAPARPTRPCRSRTAWSESTRAVSSSNFMAPWGGAEPLLGTNPIAVGIPAGNEPPVVLDIATSVVSNGQIRTYANAGQADAGGLGDQPRRRRSRSPTARSSTKACSCR